jgi:type IV pilus assembly protein PilE
VKDIRMAFKQPQPGFTVTELFIGVIILAIFLAFTFPTFIRNLEKSKTGEAVTNLTLLRMAEKEYFLEHSAFTTDIGSLNIGDPNDMVDRYFDYTITSADVTNFSARATRRGGPYEGDYYSIDKDGAIDSTKAEIKL